MARLPEACYKEDSVDKNTDGATVSVYPGAVQQGLVSNRHRVLEFFSFSAPGSPPFHLNGAISLKYWMVAIILLWFGRGYLALALALQVHHTHVHDGTQIGEGLHHSYI